MNKDQAIARVKQLTHETAQAIAPRLSTTVRKGDPTVDGCGGQFGDKVNVGYDLLFPKMPAERSHQLLLAAKAYFQKQGYTLTGFNSDGRSPSVTADTQDGFHITYVIASDGTAFVGGGSGCVAPK